MSSILGMAKQALDTIRKTGPDPAAQLPVPKPPQPAVTWLCGLDLGLMVDPTALAILKKTVEVRDGGKRRNHYAVLHLQRWIGIEYPTIAEELRPMLARLSRPATLIGDETGVGIATLQILRKAKLPVAKLRGICITSGHQARMREDGGFTVPKKKSWLPPASRRSRAVAWTSHRSRTAGYCGRNCKPSRRR